MLMSEKTAKDFMCPYSAGGPKPFGCIGPKCAAFKWFALQSTCVRKERVVLEKNERGDALGYCSMTKTPDLIQLTNQCQQFQEDEAPI